MIKELRKPVRKKELKSRGMVTIPYVKRLSEAFSRILKTYRICTAVRPHTTLRNLLLHPKDRISDEEKPEVVYKIPCKYCERVYVGETGRPLGARVKEHRKEVWIVSQESSLEQKRPGQPVSATNLQSQIMFAMRIM